jgi:hypothetical protein
MPTYTLADCCKEKIRTPAVLVVHSGSTQPLSTQLGRTTPIDIAQGADDFARLTASDASMATVVVDEALVRVRDYRGAIQDWFRVVQTGGRLILVVPHQFHFEKKLMPPSNRDAAHRRFYTGAALLAHVEEALDPYTYRVLGLEEFGTDNSHGQILLTLERVERPEWADGVMRWDIPQMTANRFFPQIPRAEMPDVAERLITTLPQTESVTRLLVLKLDHRGDFLLAQKAFRMLRGAFPEADITLCCGPWNSHAAAKLKVFDEIIEFDYFKENPHAACSGEPATDAEELLRDRLGSLSFDAAIDYRVQSDTRHLLKAARADFKIGVGRMHEHAFLDFNLDLNEATYRGQAVVTHVPASAFSVAAPGRHDGYRIVVGHGRRGLRTRLRQLTKRRLPHSMLVFGPYGNLRPGRYRLKPIIEHTGKLPALGYDISVNHGASTLKAGSLASHELAVGVLFDIESPVEGYEFRLYGPAGADFTFFGAHLYKMSENGGCHEEEMMAMLSVFSAMRLESRYSVTESNGK